MSISVEHPTDRLNFYIVSTPQYRVAFSYRTPIGFTKYDGEGWIVRRNNWSNTTGRHLNWLDNGDKASRLDGASFEAEYTRVTA